MPTGPVTQPFTRGVPPSDSWVTAHAAMAECYRKARRVDRLEKKLVEARLDLDGARERAKMLIDATSH